MNSNEFPKTKAKGQNDDMNTAKKSKIYLKLQQKSMNLLLVSSIVKINNY